MNQGLRFNICFRSNASLEERLGWGVVVKFQHRKGNYHLEVVPAVCLVRKVTAPDTLRIRQQLIEALDLQLTTLKKEQVPQGSREVRENRTLARCG